MRAACLGAVVALLLACGIEEVNNDTGNSSGETGGTGGHEGSPTGTGGRAAQGGGTSGTGAGPASADVGCGSTSCEPATEKCCFGDDASACVALADPCPAETIGPNSTTLYCDGTEDCDGSCCVADTAEGTTFKCQDTCRVEVCAPGGSCDTGLCVPDPSQPTGALCDPDGGVGCDGKTCAGAAPVCCWDGNAGAACTAAAACGDQGFFCDSAADCGPSAFCCADSAGSSCNGTCVAGTTPLCKTLADCPVVGGVSATGCGPAATDTLPPGMSSCVY